jgi:hypothetical protein
VRRSRERALFGLAVAVNLAVLFWPRTVGAGGVPYLDKAVHVLVFAAVALTGLRSGLPARWLGAALAAHAGASELVQHWLLPGRSGDPADVLADLLGVLLGLWGAPWGHERAGHGGGAVGSAAGRDAGAG